MTVSQRSIGIGSYNLWLAADKLVIIVWRLAKTSSAHTMLQQRGRDEP